MNSFYTTVTVLRVAEMSVILDESSIRKDTICSPIALQVLCKSAPNWQHYYFQS